MAGKSPFRWFWNSYQCHPWMVDFINDSVWVRDGGGGGGGIPYLCWDFSQITRLKLLRNPQRSAQTGSPGDRLFSDAITGCNAAIPLGSVAEGKAPGDHPGRVLFCPSDASVALVQEIFSFLSWGEELKSGQKGQKGCCCLMEISLGLRAGRPFPSGGLLI